MAKTTPYDKGPSSRPPATAWEDEPYRRLVESVADYAILLVDLEGRVVSWNRGAQRITGFPAGEIVGKHIALFHPQAAADKGWPAHELETAARRRAQASIAYRTARALHRGER